MAQALLLTIRFGDGRYHGVGNWPPAPARLFQALLAGAARGESLSDGDRAALAWLEGLEPPTIAAPAVRDGQGVRMFVPNNDLDAVQGKLERIADIRAGKTVKPRIFDAAQPLLYAWIFDADAAMQASAVIDIAARLYRLGRGIDSAWAQAEIVGTQEAERRFSCHGGPVFWPTLAGGGVVLLSPLPGSLESLEARYRASRRQFTPLGDGRGIAFARPPKPRFRSVSYNAPAAELLFDLREADDGKADPAFAPWPLVDATGLVTRVRDLMVRRLHAGYGERDRTVIDRFVLGRDASEADKRQRIRIVPLPSVGHAHVDHAIRRVLIEIPPDCPLPVADIEWAAAGLELGIDQETGEVVQPSGPILMRAQDVTMLRRYGLGRPRRDWQSVTPVVLPQTAARRRLEASRLKDTAEQKDGKERLAEEGRARAAVVQSLRHASVAGVVETIAVQREPFAARGARVEAFARSPRFPKERLWHVALRFAEPVAGPLVLGDGRYVGLGVMQGIQRPPGDVAVFELPTEAQVDLNDRADLLQAARRALMSLARTKDGTVPALFSGHEPDGAVPRSGQHRHVFLSAADLDGDGRIETLMVSAPWAGDRSIEPDRRDSATFERVTSAFRVLRAGRLGLLSLEPVDADERLIGSSRTWQSHTSYCPSRHGRRGAAEQDLQADLIAECGRRGLPAPRTDVIEIASGPRGGNVTARVRLRFAVAVPGPILLGRDSHRGGGLFLGQPMAAD